MIRTSILAGFTVTVAAYAFVALSSKLAKKPAPVQVSSRNKRTS